jgi:hypothetical protein
MALHTAPTPIARPRPVSGVRSDARRVVLDVNAALAPCAEGIALTDDVSAGVARITAALTAGSRMAALNETNRLGHRALAYRAEFQRLAGDIEGPEGAA